MQGALRVSVDTQLPTRSVNDPVRKAISVLSPHNGSPFVRPILRFLADLSFPFAHGNP